MADLKLRADLPEERPVHAHDIDIVLADGWQTTVATVNSEFIEPEEVERRALLLAAAPDLLAALDSLIVATEGHEGDAGDGVMCGVCRARRQAEVAIAKARGKAADAS